jgi:uncharacterized membrane protein
MDRRALPGRTFEGRTWILALAAAGALSSLVLELLHYRAYADPGADSFCALGARLDCSSVALSSYAVFLGLPLPIWGFVGFIAIGLSAWQASRWLLPLSALAALAGLVLTAVSGWGVGAWCLLCEVTHALSLALALLAWRARGGLDRPFSSAEASAVAFLPALGVLIGARLFVPPYWAVFTWKGELPLGHGKTETGDPWIGAEQPRLTLEEFVDYSCPHCRVASARSLQRVSAHPMELRIVRRHFPSTMCHPRSDTRCLPLRIALCADEQDRFWQADRWLFQHAQGGHAPDVTQAARDLALDAARLAACVTSEATFDRAIAEWRRAKKARVPGTPYYLNERRLITATAAGELIDAL